MTLPKLIGRSLVSIAFLLLVSSGLSAETLCHIADPQDPTLNVRETPGGKVINALQNERVVREDEVKADARGKSWSRVSSSYKGDWRNWGWVFKDRLNCVDTDRFRKEQLSVASLKAAGLVPQSATNTKALPISCDQIPNGWGVSISTELFQMYRKRGFSPEAICFGLGSSWVNFDPETGQLLKLYEINGDIFGLRPLWLPDCYSQLQITGRGGYLIGWRPTGCAMRFHPSTGKRISKPELVELAAGGEAGGAWTKTIRPARYPMIG